jgi:hypothetical protein
MMNICKSKKYKESIRPDPFTLADLRRIVFREKDAHGRFPLGRSRIYSCVMVAMFGGVD